MRRHRDRRGLLSRVRRQEKVGLPARLNPDGARSSMNLLPLSNRTEGAAAFWSCVLSLNQAARPLQGGSHGCVERSACLRAQEWNDPGVVQVDTGHSSSIEGASPIKWEFPRLRRGGLQTLRIPGVFQRPLLWFCRGSLSTEPHALAVAFASHQLRSGLFERPATERLRLCRRILTRLLRS